MSEPIRTTAPPAEREPAGKSPSSWAEVRRLARQVYGSQLRRLTLVNALGAAAAVCEVATLSLVLLAAQALMQGAKEATVPRLAEVGLPAVWAIDRLLLFAAAAVIVRLILRLGESWASARIAADYECDQRLRLAAALLRADWKSQSAEPSGRIQVLLTKHVLIAARTLFSLSAVTAAATNLCVLIVAAVVVDWQCAAAIFAVTSVVFILVRPLSSSAQRRNRSQMAIYSQFANDLGQGVALSRELRTFGVVEPFFRRIRTAIEQYRGFRVEQMLLNHVVGPLYQNLALLLLVGGMAAIYFTGFQRLESLGFVVVMFVRSLAYGQQLQASVHAVHDGVPYLEELRDAEDAYAYAVVSNVGRRLPTVETIGMRDVEFAYDRRKPVLRNVTFEARRGELIGVAGPSGCGKTTLVQLLLRLYDADAGDVLINGRPCREFSAADWPSRFACVPQESLMFDDSLADCIRFFRDGFTDEQVHRAAERAHLHEEIAALPDGYATRAGERGRKLSGGQRQRLSLARAVAGRPDVLVLDEPTGALDVAAEAAVLQTLLELRGEVTSFIVSHRPSTLQVCDRVLLLKDGRVQSFDSPERLSECFPPFTADVASST